MSQLSRLGSALVMGFAALSVFVGTESSAQVTNNPYRAIYGWEKISPGRKLGVVSGIYLDPDGKHLWMLSRCGGNNCAGVDVDPILKFDLDGNLVKSFGKGLFGWPHGFFVDHEGYIWVTEGAPAGERRGEEAWKFGKGHQVFKLSPEGNVLMTLGEAGVHGDDQAHFNGPSHVAVNPVTGDIWVADEHRGGNNRLVRFSKDGKFITEIGGGVESATAERGLFNDPHHIAFDSQGRLFVADRGNNRIQIFDRDGTFIGAWTHFGRPSSIAIDDQDRIYVVDGTTSLTGESQLGFSGGGSYGYERGIRIGDAETGWIYAFIPETTLAGIGEDGTPRGVSQEFIGLDSEGNIYVGEVQGQRLAKWVPIRPLAFGF